MGIFSLRDWITEGVGKLLNGLKLVAATIVGRVLGTFGLSLISMQALLPNLKSFVQDYVNSLPPQLLQLFGAVGGDIAMSMILSALAVRLAWKVFLVPKSVADGLGQ